MLMWPNVPPWAQIREHGSHVHFQYFIQLSRQINGALPACPLLQKSICFIYMKSIYSYVFSSLIGFEQLFKPIIELLTHSYDVLSFSWLPAPGTPVGQHHLVQSQTNLHSHASFSSPYFVTLKKLFILSRDSVLIRTTEIGYHRLVIGLNESRCKVPKGGYSVVSVHKSFLSSIPLGKDHVTHYFHFPPLRGSFSA